MSKKKRNQQTAAEKQLLKKEREAFEATKRKVRKVTAIVTASLILLAVLASVVGYAVHQIRLNRGDYLRREIAAATSQTEIDGAMMNYFFNDVYNTFVDYYGSYVQYYGLDTTAPLRHQYIDETTSWFDYFMSGAKTTVTNLLALKDDADEAGTQLSQEQKEALRVRASETDEGLYGRGVNQDDIYAVKLLEAQAYGHQFAKRTAFAPTDAEITEEFEKNNSKYTKTDYLAFPLYYSENGMSEDEAKAWADKLAATKTEDAFVSMCKEILLFEDPAMSKEDIDNSLGLAKNSGMLLTEGNEMSEWAFSAKTGDTHIFPNQEETSYTVCMLTAERYPDESRTVHMRHILLTDRIYGNRDKALKAAQDLLTRWQASGASAEAFALLALEKSEDTGSYYNGGKYEYAVDGQFETAINDWCFDVSRKVGDTGVIETDIGVHILLFEGEGPSAYQASVANTIASQRISEYLTEITKTHPVVFDENVLDMIP